MTTFFSTNTNVEWCWNTKKNKTVNSFLQLKNKVQPKANKWCRFYVVNHLGTYTLKWGKQSYHMAKGKTGYMNVNM